MLSHDCRLQAVGWRGASWYCRGARYSGRLRTCPGSVQAGFSRARMRPWRMQASPDERNPVSGRRKRVPDGCDSEPVECDSVSGGCNQVPAGCSPGQPIAIASPAGASVLLLPASGRSQLCSVPRRGHCRSRYLFRLATPKTGPHLVPTSSISIRTWSECAAIRASFQPRQAAKK
jgi:hypothetical protein